jgi:ribose transport system substrate-binding protein
VFNLGKDRAKNRRLLVSIFGVTAVSLALLISGGAAAASSGNGVAQAQSQVTKWMTVPKTIPQDAPLPRRAPKGKSIAFLTDTLPATVQENDGVEAAARAIGWKFYSISIDPNNPSSYVTGLQNALTHHPTIVSMPGEAPADLPASILKTYKQAHVPIVFASTSPVKTSHWILGTPNGAPYNVLSGNVISDWFIANSKGTGQALFVNVPIFPILKSVQTGFDQPIAKQCPKCVVKTINVSFPEIQSGTVVSDVVSTLKSNPNLNYVIFDLGNFADGLPSALAAAGLSKVKVAGVGMDTEGAAALGTKTEAAWTGQSFYYVGYSIVDTALRWLEGVKFPSAGLDTLSPTQLLTSANIGKVSNWNQPVNSLAQFEKLWKVPITPCRLGCSGR